MAVVISAMAPNYCTPSLSLHGSSRLSRASGASMPPPAPPAPAKEDAQDSLFTDEEFEALMSGQAQLLCRDDDARSHETSPDDALPDLEEPISDEDIERLASLFCDEEIEALCAAQQQQQASTRFSWLRSDDQAGKKRMSSPPWPSCIADDDDEEDEEEEAGPPPPPPPTKKARTETKSRSRSRREYAPPPPPPRPIKKARTQTKSSSSREHAAAAARAARLQHRLWRWRNTIANRILTRQFRAPEPSRGRTALWCQCTELVLADGFGCCALHQDALPEDRAWVHSAQGHAPLVGGPGEVLVPAVSAGDSRAMVRQYARWRRSVSMPSRFYVQHAVEKGLAQQLPDDDWTTPQY